MADEKQTHKTKKGTKLYIEIEDSKQSASTPLSIFCFGTTQTREKHSESLIGLFIKKDKTKPRIIIEGPDALGTDVVKNSQDAVIAILEWLETAEENSDGKYQINLSGFSRGAVTCTRIANELQALINNPALLGKLNKNNSAIIKKLNKISCRILAIDAVPGPTDKAHNEVRTIPNIVSEYVGILQKDEQRQEFKPLDFSRLQVENFEKTKITLLPLSGQHSHSVYNPEAKDSEKRGDKILFDQVNLLMHAFYKMPLDDPQDDKKHENAIYPQQAQAIKALCRYQEIHEKAKIYGNLPSKPFAIPHGQRTFNDHLADYVSDSHFFMNQHERELFKLIYPHTFNYYFEHAVDNKGVEDKTQEVKKELVIMRNKIPDLFTRLKTHGYFSELADNIIETGEPQGGYRIEEYRFMRQLFPEVVSAFLNPPKPTAESNALYQLEQEVRQLTYYMRRNKSEVPLYKELVIMPGNTDGERAIAIRKEMREILQKNKTDQDKLSAILDLLAKNHCELAQINPSGRFAGKIEKILNKNNRAVKLTPTHFYGSIWLFAQILSITKELIIIFSNLVLSTLKVLALSVFLGLKVLFAFVAAVLSLGNLNVIKRMWTYLDVPFSLGSHLIWRFLRVLSYCLNKPIEWINQEFSGYKISVGESLGDEVASPNQNSEVVQLSNINRLYLVIIVILAVLSTLTVLLALHVIPSSLPFIATFLAHLPHIASIAGSVMGLAAGLFLFIKFCSSKTQRSPEILLFAMLNLALGVISVLSLTPAGVALLAPLAALFPLSHMAGIAVLFSLISVPCFPSSNLQSTEVNRERVASNRLLHSPHFSSRSDSPELKSDFSFDGQENALIEAKTDTENHASILTHGNNN